MTKTFPWQLTKSECDNSIFIDKSMREYVEISQIRGFLVNKMGIKYDRNKSRYKNSAFEGEQHQISTYQSLYNENHFETKYFLPKHRWGRIHASGSSSIGLFHRPTRHGLCINKYCDIDMVCCQPRILCEITRQHGHILKRWEAYVKDPKKLRFAIADFYKVSYDSAKQLLLRICFGGSYLQWLKDEGITNNSLIKQVVEMEEEMLWVIEKVFEHNQHIAMDVKEAKGEGKYNREYPCLKDKKLNVMGLWCQTVERLCQESVISWLVNNKGFVIEDIVSCQDGFMILEQLYYEGINNDCVKAVFGKMGFEVDFIVKAFDEAIEIPRASVDIGASSTLYIKNGLNEDDYYCLPLWKRYLYHIPFQAKVSRNIGFALKKVGATVQDYIEWLGLNPFFHESQTPDIIKDYSKFYDKSNSKKSFGIPLLRRLAKVANPDFFKSNQEYIRRLFQLDYTDITRITETSEFVSQEGTTSENNIFTPCKFLSLSAYMGRGKSTAIKRLIPLYKSFLILTPRQAFALFMKEEFKADCYLDGHFSSQNQIISLESLPKLRKNDYELIILDECESIFSNFSSTTLNGKHIEVFNQLMALLNQSKKVIFADAFISNRTLDLIRSLQGDAVIIENVTPPITRNAFEIHPDAFFEKQLELKKAGKKIFACYSSVTKLREDVAKFKAISLVSEEMKDFVDKIQQYHGRVSDNIMRTLDNINTTWKDASMVLTSPSITVGNSYSTKDEFDCVMILGSPTCTVRDTFQTHMRVRHLKDNNLYYALPKASAMNFSKCRADLIFDVLEEYELFNLEKKDIVIGLIDKIIEEREKNGEESYNLKCLKMSYEHAETCPDNLKQILYYNLFEQTVSCRYYKDLFGFFLNKCGYNIQGIENKEPSNQEFKCEYETHLRYENLESINQERQEEIELLIKQKRATDIEKMTNEKYWFDKKINPELSSDIKAELFQEVYLNSSKRALFDNIHSECIRSIDDVLKNDAVKSGFGLEMNPMRAIQFNYMSQLNKLLELKNGYSSGQMVSRKHIEDILPYLEQERKNIHSAFKFRDQSKKDELNFESGSKLLKKIYTNWSGLDFVGENPDRKKKYASYVTRNFLDEEGDVQLFVKKDIVIKKKEIVKERKIFMVTSLDGIVSNYYDYFSDDEDD